jgi:hypothetical protein
VPPPWHLHGDAYGLLVWMPKRAPQLGEPPSTSRAQPQHSGPGLMAFIRYDDSEVGPYDELLWLQPCAHGAGRAWRPSVTRIFVSTEPSVYNGRVNWGLPKELASFSVRPLSGGSLHVEVTSGGEPVASFTFSSGQRWLPFETRLIPRPWRTLVQELEGRRFKTVPRLRGRLHRARSSELVVNPALFPDVRTGSTLAEFCLRRFEMLVPEPDVSP